ncbi:MULTISPECIES: aminoglycoside phosphotransferase family protein [Methylotenera]|uniref:aminoglycoside phosphotransferase family protein n=1 Tax=Methylotenera TaxID=359407 RepID=UPI000362E16C|nr:MULTISPECIES: phosphotransferase [Methylotenera]
MKKGFALDRQLQLTAWLNATLKQTFTLTTASADASFRRYFRVHLVNPHLGHQTLIAMDAPPPQEDCAPFVKIAQLLLDAGLNAPKILEQDLINGFLLLSDLGDTTYLSQLNAQRENISHAQKLYSDATNALVKMQLASQTDVLPAYDEALLTREMQLFPDWYISKHLGVTLNAEQQAVLNNTFNVLNQNILAQGKVIVHRDYHSRNLMVTDANNPGVLDFQDAVYGAVTYDLVSLLKDAYIEWDEEQIIDWAVRYWQPAKKAGLPVSEDFSEFYRDFEWMGVQRHIKVLGIFARLSHRDGKDGYLKDMPLVMRYLRKVCERYVELRPMLRLLNQLENVKPQEGFTF